MHGGHHGTLTVLFIGRLPLYTVRTALVGFLLLNLLLRIKLLFYARCIALYGEYVEIMMQWLVKVPRFIDEKHCWAVVIRWGIFNTQNIAAADVTLK